MKTLFALLFLALASVAPAQQLISIRPVISTTKVDSVIVTNNSTTVELDNAAVGDFASVVAGVQVYGNNIPFGTTVSSNSGDTLLVLSAKATETVLLDSLRFGYFTSAAYADGDALGFPFQIGTVKEIKSVFVVDDADQMTSLELVFFTDAYRDTARPTDNLPFNPTDNDGADIIGYRVLSVTQDWGSFKSVTMDDTELPISIPRTRDADGNSRLYVQMVATGAWTFVAVDDIIINFIVE